MRNEPQIRALQIVLEQIESGTSLEEALALYPQWARELRPLAEAALAASSLGQGIRVPQEAQELSRERYLQTAQRLYVGGTTRRRAGLGLPSGAGRERSGSAWAPAWRLGLAALALVAILAIGALSAARVSAQALPGEPLYPVKIAAERGRLLLAHAPASRLELEQEFDRERLEEVETLINRGEENPAGQAALPINFVGILKGMQPGVWQVDQVQVRVPPETQIVGQVQAGYAVQVTGLLQSGGEVLAQRIQAREFELAGRVKEVKPDRLEIEDVKITLTPQTVLIGTPAKGNQVKILAYLAADGSLVARRVEVAGVTPSAPPAGIEDNPLRQEDDHSSGGDGLLRTPEAGEDHSGPAPVLEDGGDDKGSGDSGKEDHAVETPKPAEGGHEDSHAPENTGQPGEDHDGESGKETRETPRPGEDHDGSSGSGSGGEHHDETPKPSGDH